MTTQNYLTKKRDFIPVSAKRTIGMTKSGSHLQYFFILTLGHRFVTLNYLPMRARMKDFHFFLNVSTFIYTFRTNMINTKV